MKIVIIGLGSMGKRRIRNLLKLGYRDIIGFDTRDDRRNEVEKNYSIQTFSNLKNALEQKPDIMIISTPPDAHLEYANIAINNNIDFFMEINLFSKDVKKIIKKTERKSIIALPSSTMRFHPVVKELKKLLDRNAIGKILTIHHHTGHFLPNWHPWEDYRNFFASKKETGGARETVPVELLWLTYLFSEVKSTYGNIGKISKLETDIDDIYQIFLKFKNKISCILMIDVISRPSFRETKIIGEKGTIICDFNRGYIKINKGEKWKNVKLKMGKIAKGYKKSTPPETLYEEEIQNFLDIVKRQKKPSYSLHDELKILQTLDAIELSNKKRKKITLNNLK